MSLIRDVTAMVGRPGRKSKLPLLSWWESCFATTETYKRKTCECGNLLMENYKIGLAGLIIQACFHRRSTSFVEEPNGLLENKLEHVNCHWWCQYSFFSSWSVTLFQKCLAFFNRWWSAVIVQTFFGSHGPVIKATGGGTLLNYPCA